SYTFIVAAIVIVILATLNDSARDQGVHAKVFRHLLWFDVPLLVTERRRARDHFQIRESREPVDYPFRDAIAQIFHRRIAARIGERQYGNRADAGASDAAKVEHSHRNSCGDTHKGYRGNKHLPLWPAGYRRGNPCSLVWLCVPFQPLEISLN